MRCRPSLKQVAVFAMLIAFAADASAETPSVREITTRIDAHFERVWQKAALNPAVEVDDSEFLRRAYLSLVGHIPPVAVVRQFLTDKLPTKRQELIRRLLASGEFPRHAATQWRRTWLPQSDSPQLTRQAREFELWFAEEIDRGTSHDQLVAKFLTVSDFADGDAPSPGTLPTSSLLLAVSDGRPENLAANSMRAFAGLQLECAQCHDHPFATWKQEQFWQTAAFFAKPTVNRPNAAEPVLLEIAVPETDRMVAAAFIDDSDIEWTNEPDSHIGRQIFAQWLTRRENPYFARNAVNQIWRQLFGRDLASPLEDLSLRDNSHRELLDELAALFNASRFDLKKLTMAIMLSRPYQTASCKEPSEAGDEHFCCYTLHPLSGEQLYDSLLLAGGFPPDSSRVRVASSSKRLQFAALFPTSADARPSVPQSLVLMNGVLVEKITNPQTGRLLSAVTEAPFLNDTSRIETLYLATVSRPPNELELQQSLRRLQGATNDRARAMVLADLLWVLVNSAEFRTNH